MDRLEDDQRISDDERGSWGLSLKPPMTFLQACRQAVKVAKRHDEDWGDVFVNAIVDPVAHNQHPALVGYYVTLNRNGATEVRRFRRVAGTVIEVDGRYVLEDAWQEAPAKVSEPKHVVERMAEYTEKHLSEPAALPGFQRPPNRRGPDTNVAGDVCVTRKIDKAPGIRPPCNCGRNPQGPGAADPAAHNSFCAYTRDAVGVTIQVDDTTLAQAATGTVGYGSWQVIFRSKAPDGRIQDYCRESYPLVRSLEWVVREAKVGINSQGLHGAIIEIF